MDTNSSVTKQAWAETGGEDMEKKVDDKTAGMTPLCRVALLKSRETFVKDLNIKPLVDYLLSKFKLTPEDSERILARQTPQDQRRTLLNLLPGKGQGSYDELVNYLEKDQPFILSTLATNFNNVKEADLKEVSLPLHLEKGLSPRCRLALLKSEEVLTRDLDVNQALDHLLSKLTLMPNDEESVLTRSTSTDRRRALISLLQQKGLTAYEELMKYLQHNQPHVWNTVQRNYDSVTEDELATAGFRCDIGSARTTQLQDALRTGIRKYLDNDPSKLLPKPETSGSLYIPQPISARKVTCTDAEQLQITDAYDLLEACSPGQPLFLYGAAGMGKSTLCRQIAKLWANGDSRLCGTFTYVFPIPMQLVRSRRLIDIICDDAKLMPDTCKELLQEEIDLNTGKVLLLLDSYEELIHTADVGKINRLILNEIEKETLVVMLTSRPHPRTEKLEAFVDNRITAQLEDLSEDQIERYMEEYPNLGTTTKGLLIQKFGIGFLQRPVNLWLSCYAAVTVVGSTMALPRSQVALLNIIVQHILVAFLKKKNLSGVQLNNKSPLMIQHCPVEYKAMLKEAGKICYNAIENGNHSIEIGLFSKAELLSFGLFADAGEEGYVVLPHNLFKEYLAALYLSAEEAARNALLKQIRDKSLSTSPTPCLVDLLRYLGLENVILFLVGLLPSTVKPLTELFVVKQSKVCFRFQMANKEWENLKRDCMHSFLDYELKLYQESSDRDAQAAIANGLLFAKVIEPDDTSYRDFVPNRGCHLLLSCFNAEERQTFLALYYNCRLLTVLGRSALKKLVEDRTFLLDSFVVGAIIMQNCQVRMDEVWFRNAYLPVQMVANNLQHVGKLVITNSTLCANTAEFASCLGLDNMHTVDIHHSTQQAIEGEQNNIRFKSVRGLKHMTANYTWPGACVLGLELCDVSAEQLSQCFPAVSTLLLFFADKSFFSATPLGCVENLLLRESDPTHVKNIRETFPGLQVMKVMDMTILVDDKQPTWPGLELLILTNVHVKDGDISLNQEQAKETLAKMCPHAELEIDHYMDEHEAAAMDHYIKTFSQAYRGDTDEVVY